MSEQRKPSGPSANGPNGAPHSQTLSRGIRVLEILADADEALTIADVAAALGVHRSIAYRILRTLEDHGVVIRDAAGAVRLGPRMAALARGVSRGLQAAALPELTSVANELGMTAFVTVLDRAEVVTLVSVEPRQAHATVAQRPGTRHPLGRGAPGIAIQSLLTATQWVDLGEGARRGEAADVRARGFATSHDEVIPGLASVAVPLVVPGEAPAALAVVYLGTGQSDAAIGARLVTAAAVIAADLR
ncbi:ArsR family transcriptional regulator [Cryobacterium sandaracinum]|uniref:ArsR family transcriptional regulator n=1 Tax=Cryobacterium sandaracinum TaxID=1259247 RepID=A0ABY2JL67_9MICO|nr:helix-turn-helix domain-containing protein [Cryobacterium sandaracinum]TFD07339.1 ArsR family transcriptional regulator [Cryobacterium sandaracinum]